MGLEYGIEVSLKAKLDAALENLADSDEANDAVATGILGAFVNEVLTQGGRAANQYELPLGWNGLLPLVANLCEKLNDL